MANSLWQEFKSWLRVRTSTDCHPSHDFKFPTSTDTCTGCGCKSYSMAATRVCDPWGNL